MMVILLMFFFFKQKTAYEMRISDWSSDVCSSDLLCLAVAGMFAYDVFHFADALLYRMVDETFLRVRGFVVVSLIPLFVINIFRAESRHLVLALSAQMVFGSTVVLGTGV